MSSRVVILCVPYPPSDRRCYPERPWDVVKACLASVRRHNDCDCLLILTAPDWQPKPTEFERRGIHVWWLPRPHRTSLYDMTLAFVPATRVWDQCVYLDWDTIVRQPLDELFAVEGFAAVSAPVPHETLGSHFNVTEFLPWDEVNAPAFNTGVMAWRSSALHEDTFSDLRSLAAQYHADARFPGESILNLYWLRRWQALPQRWNGITRLIGQGDLADEEVAILHSAGGEKAWHEGNPWHQEWVASLDEFEQLFPVRG